MAKIDTQHQRDSLDQLRSRFQDLYVKRMPILKSYEKLANTTVHSLLGETMPEMQRLYGQAKQIGDEYSQNFVPATERYLQSAEGYDTPERRAEASGRAMADVTTAGETARAGALQRLESYGIDPSQTRGAALDQNLRVQTALDAVKQGRDAATGVEERGRAYVSDALGKGAQSAAATSDLARTGAGLSATAGQLGEGAVDATNRTANLWTNIYGTPSGNLVNQQNLINDTVNAKATETSLKMGAKKSNAAGQIGSLAGTVIGGAAGLYFSGGNPAVGMAGAAAGRQIGGMAGGAMGGGSATGMGEGGGGGGMNFTYAPQSGGGGGSATGGNWTNEYW